MATPRHHFSFLFFRSRPNGHALALVWSWSLRTLKAIAFTHNPASMAAMKGNLIRMSGVRDALELDLIYPCSTPTMDMVSDLNTKACSCKDRE